jgi:hypothetical protein
MNSNIDRILLGDNPFIGVDHLSQERSRERKEEFDSNKIARVVDSALTAGAQGLACSAHPMMENTLRYLKDENYSRQFGVYLIVPDAQSYVRQAAEKGMIGLLNETFGKLGAREKARAVFSGGLSVLTSNPTRLMRTYLDSEISLFFRSLPKNARIKSVFLHELLTELIVSFNMKELAREYIDFVKGSLEIMPGFVTRNFAKFVDFVSLNGMPMHDIVVMTPFNKVGFQMNPSRVSSENILLKFPDLNVIAMSVLASGYLNLNDSIDYLAKLPRPVACVVGVSTEAHARETFSLLSTGLNHLSI